MAPECSLVAARPHRRGRRGGGRFRDGRQRSGANGGSGSGWDRRGALEQPRPFLERSGAFRLRLAPFPSCHGGDSHCDKRLSNRPEYRSAGLEAANRNLLMRRGRSSAFWSGCASRVASETVHALSARRSAARRAGAPSRWQRDCPVVVVKEVANPLDPERLAQFVASHRSSPWVQGFQFLAPLDLLLPRCRRAS